MVIDRMRRGTHDRADTTGPCRGCATAVGCRAASRTSRRACPCRVLLCTPHIKLAEPRYMCLDSCSRGRPRTSRRPRVSGDAGHTQITATSGKRKPFGAVTSIRSHDYQGNARTHATGGGFPDARLLLPAGRVHPVCIAQGICSWHARRLTQIGRQRPL